MLPATFRIEALQRSHDRKAFGCGSPALDRYLLQRARQDADKRVAAPFMLVDPPATAVLGYYALSASVIEVDEIPPEMARRLPRYPQLPVTLLGRLAVDGRLKGLGAGEFLLMDALRRGLAAAAEIAAIAVVVDAKDPAAEAFYRYFDFIPLQGNPARLFLPMKMVAAIFG